MDGTRVIFEGREPSGSRDRRLDAGLAPERSPVVPHGVDAARFFPLSHDERAGVRAHLGLRDDETLLYTIGPAEPDAGVDVLLKAFARLRRDGLRLRLLLRVEDPGGAADHNAVILAAAEGEPALLLPETLSAITTVPSLLEGPVERLLHGAADCYVSPRRATAFADPVFEAIAVGTPVIVTRGGAAEGVCDDDVAWFVSGAPRDEEAAGRCLAATDPGELAEAIATVAGGRGFDRIRFAAARMRLLRRFTSRHPAPAAEPGAPATATGPGPAALTGQSQPIGDRFAAQPASGVAAQRRRAQSRLRCAAWEALSVVVQGPCLRVETDLGAPPIDAALASIRRWFPGAQVVVSTWAGSDVSGLDADDIVLSPDPGSFPNNVNRQVTSTINGLAAATRPFAIKTRNDIVFHSDALGRKDLWRAAGFLSLERRIWAEANRIETSLRPFHPSDIIQFGTTEDLRRLWNVPVITLDAMFLPGTPAHPVRPASEQAIFLGYLRGIGIDVRLDHTFDTRYSIVAASLHHMLGAFDVFDAEREEIALAPKFRKNPARIRLMETPESFDGLRRGFAREPEATSRRVHEAALATMDRLRTSG